MYCNLDLRYLAPESAIQERVGMYNILLKEEDT